MARYRRQLWWVGALVLAVAVTMGVGRWRDANRPNILLITLDTTRADRIGCYGYQQALTPTLDALAAEGVLFERAYVTAPLTLPSHASLFTGLYPQEHGLINNAIGRLDNGIPTLAETLRRSGYDTSAFVGSFVLDAKFGLNRGFKTYDDEMTEADTHGNALHRQRDGQQVVDRAVKWLSRSRSAPFLCWVHLYDAHFPYQAHGDQFGETFQDRPYDGELAYVDLQIRRLLDQLDQNQLRRRTLIVVVGDHGESLGEHDEDEHGDTLYDAALRVPCIWAGYGVKAAGHRVSQAVSLIDLAPTMLAALDQRPFQQISGRSVQPALSGENFTAIDCYAATDAPLFNFRCAPLRCLVAASWKYIRSTEPELYDLDSDPRELNNLAAEHPSRVADMEARTAGIEAAMTLREAADVQLSQREQRALESLGYLSAKSSPLPDSDEPLPDVKQVLPLSREVRKAGTQFHAGHVKEAEEIVRNVLAQSPGFVEAELFLAELYFTQSKFDESDAILDQVLEKHPDEHMAHYYKGLVADAMQRPDLAIGHFRTTIQLDPNAVLAFYNLGLNLLKQGELPEAEQCFQDALELDPAYVNALVGLGMVSTFQKEPDRAIEYYRTALTHDPQSVESHSNLASLLLQQRKIEDALEHLAQAAKIAPDNPDARYNYGSLLLDAGRVPQAVEELSAAVRLKPSFPQAAARLRQAKAKPRQ